MAVIGTCSLCRGAVTVPDVWHGVEPPTPSCSRCHAFPKQPHGPVVEMEPPPGLNQGKAVRTDVSGLGAAEARKLEAQGVPIERYRPSKVWDR